MNYGKSFGLKVPYYEKHSFSGFYMYKPVLPDPANSQNEENKHFLHMVFAFFTISPFFSQKLLLNR